MSDKPQWNKVRFRVVGGMIYGATIELDDHPLHHVRRFSFESSVDAPNVVRIEFLTDDVEIEAESTGVHK